MGPQIGRSARSGDKGVFPLPSGAVQPLCGPEILVSLLGEAAMKTDPDCHVGRQGKNRE